MAETLSLHDRLRARLQLVRNDLEGVMGRLQEADIPFAPSDGMRTIGGQLAEIAGTETQIMAWLRDGKTIPWEEANNFYERGASLAGMREALTEIRAETLRYLDSLSEEQLE